MDEFPKMLFKAGGSEPIHGAKLDTRIVHDADEEDGALADGWCLTTPEALEPKEKAPPVPDDDAPATSEELKQKARELGIEFRKNASDETLTKLIEEKLAENKE